MAKRVLKVAEVAVCRVTPVGRQMLMELRFRKKLGAWLPEDSSTFRLTLADARLLCARLTQQLPDHD